MTSPATASSTSPSPTQGDDTVSVLLGNGDGTFQPQVTYAVGSDPDAIVAGDFTGDGQLDLAVAELALDPTARCRCCWATATAPSSPRSPTRSGRAQTRSWRATSPATAGSTWPSPTYGRRRRCRCCWATATARSSPRSLTRWGRTQTRSWRVTSTATATSTWPSPDSYGDDTVSVLLGNGDGTFQPQVTYAVGSQARSPSWRVTSPATADSTSPSPTQVGQRTSRCCWATATARSTQPGQFATTPHATPLVADVNGDGTDDVLVVDGAGDILYRQGIPGQPGTFEPPVTVNPGYPLARHRLGSQHGSRGRCSPASMPRTTPSRSTPIATAAFVRVGSLATGQLPAQIIAADLNGNGWDDLVVRNAGDGTLSVFFSNDVIGPASSTELQALPRRR